MRVTFAVLVALWVLLVLRVVAAIHGIEIEVPL